MNRSGKIGLKDLCRVGRGTPAGEWFRRYWLVVGTGKELKDIPQAVKVLGEELVLFRDESASSVSWVCTARIAARRWSTAT